jgi:DNA-binding Xre family transcriptional regulator
MLRLKVKEMANAKKISMSKLSRLSDVSYDTIQQIYHNPYKDVNLSTLEKIADALSINVCDLFEKVSEEEMANIPPQYNKKLRKVAENSDTY